MLNTRVKKARSLQWDFVDFGRSEARFRVILEAPGAHFGGPGAHFGGLGAHVEDFWDCCDFEDVPGAKGYSL